MRGNPQTMKGLADYENVVDEVYNYLSTKLLILQEKGIRDIVIDPGFGFAKTIEHNYEILNSFERFTSLGYPILAGLSRKSMIWKILDVPNEEALNGTTVLNTIALIKGANILRVHDVKAAVEAVKLLEKMKS
jgi:dihydropteroate synthase